MKSLGYLSAMMIIMSSYLNGMNNKQGDTKPPEPSYPLLYQSTAPSAPASYTPSYCATCGICPSHLESVKSDVRGLNDQLFALKTEVTQLKTETVKLNNALTPLFITPQPHFIIRLIGESKPIIITGLTFLFFYKLLRG